MPPHRKRSAEPRRHEAGETRTDGDSSEQAREDFARALARAEFGRFYWNERLSEALQRSLQRSRRRLTEKKAGKSSG